MSTSVTITTLLGLGILGMAATGAEEDQSWIHPKAEKMASPHMGPYVNLPDGHVLAVDGTRALISSDEGKTWEAHPLFADTKKFYTRPERALIRTKDGVVVLVFLNERELTRGEWKVNDKEALSKFYLPTYVTRSLDDGKTWEGPQKIQDGWCGAIRSLIQLKSGRLVLAGQDMVFDPGRHVVMTYVSDDDGKTWKKSNIIDLGGAGSHGGTMEATVAEMKDGRVYMIIRTTRGWFWEAFSKDGGLTWTGVSQSRIRSSTCCGTLGRLASGRLALLWNRSPEGMPYDKNSREELSMAFSEDDGKTWSKPIVIARDPGKRQSYPYVFERRPGELWITTMQGKVRIKVKESDFVNAKEKLDQPIRPAEVGAEHQVICKEPGRYIGWPTVGRKTDGELLVVFSGDRDQHVCPYGKTQIVRSRDNGKTWTEPETINDCIIDDRDAGILVCRSGAIVISWFTSLAFEKYDCRKMYGDAMVDAWKPYIAKITDEDRKKELGHWVRRSTDGGKTWLPKQKIEGTAPHGPIQLDNGHLIFLGNAAVNGDHTIVAEESTDDGATWKVIGKVPFPNYGNAYWGEPHLAQTTQGRLVAHFRHNKGDYSGYLFQSESDDGGRTWTEAHRLPIWGFPPYLIRLRDGRLLTTYGYRRKPYGQRACLSDDGGETWNIDREILLRDDAPNGDLGYPSTVELGDGEMLTVYYQIDKPGEKTGLMATRWRLPK
ncbi:MAG: exo-alpha-sialidase [Planctomycetes bacterium]|nr:exo-alpha-sialidase [Planctomycetota bacterium]